MDDSRDNKKNRFSNTMAFMEEYLNNVLNDELPFHNEEKNKLTYEVSLAFRGPKELYVLKDTLPSISPTRSTTYVDISAWPILTHELNYKGSA